MPKGNISYIKPSEPNFIRKLKEQIGYKEGPTIETKKESLPEGNEEDFEDKDDEKPVVVVLRSGDLTEAEVSELKKEEEDKPVGPDTRITFRKPPPKRKTDEPEEQDSSKAVKKARSTRKQLKNSSLLSFNEDEDDG